MQYGVSKVLSRVKEEARQFTSSTLTGYLHLVGSSLKFDEFYQIPDTFLDCKLIMQYVATNYTTLSFINIAGLLERYVHLLKSLDASPSNDLPTETGFADLPKLVSPLVPVFKTRKLPQYADLLTLPLLCTQYSNCFIVTNPEHLSAIRTLLCDLDLTEIARNFKTILADITRKEQDTAKDIVLSSPLYHLVLQSLCELIVRKEAPPGEPVSTQLQKLGSWVDTHVRPIHPQDLNQCTSLAEIAFFRQCIFRSLDITREDAFNMSPASLPLLVMTSASDYKTHIFSREYDESRCKIRATLESVFTSICEKQITKAQLNHLNLSRFRGEPIQFELLGQICKLLFPQKQLPSRQHLRELFETTTQELKELRLLRIWLNAKARVRIHNVSQEASIDDGTLSELISCLNEHRTSLGLAPESLKALLFFVGNKSAFFEVILIDETNHILGGVDSTRETLSAVINSTISIITDFVLGKVQLPRVKTIFDKLSAVDYSAELQLIEKFLRASHCIPDNHPQLYLDDAISLLLYLSHIPAICNCCEQYKLCLQSAQELSSFSLTCQTINLTQCPSYLSKVREMVGGMHPSKMPFFDSLSIATDVLDWFQQFTPTEFEEKSAFVRGLTQGWDFGSRLEMCVSAAHRFLEPFQRIRSTSMTVPTTTVHDLCLSLSAVLGNSDAEVRDAIHKVATVHENLAQIKVMFSQSAGLSLEALLPYVTRLRQRGCYRSRLALHNLGVPSLVLLVHVDGSGSESGSGLQEESQSYLMNLIRAMKIFINSQEERDELNVREFVKIFRWAEKMHMMRLTLESLGHPNYQGGEALLNQLGDLMNADRIKNSYLEIKKILSNWAAALRDEYRQEPRLNFLSGRQLTALSKRLTSLAILTPAAITSAPDLDIEGLMPYLWACFPDIPTARTLPAAKQALINVIEHLSSNPSSWDPLSSLKLVRTFVSHLHQTLSENSDCNQILNGEIVVILAESFSPSSVTYLLYELFSFIPPHPSQLLYGKTATQSDLDRFLFCVSCFQRLQFVIIGVNELQESLRRQLYKWTCDVSASEKPTFSKLHLIFTSRVGVDMFYSPIPKQEEMVLTECVPLLQKSPVLNPRNLLRSAGIGVVLLYTGGPCSGKSTEIHSRMRTEAVDVVCLNFSITEGFSLGDVVEAFSKIIARLKGGPRISSVDIHVEISAYADIPVVSALLYNFVVWRLIWDYNTGTMLFLPRGVVWNLYVEIATVPAEDETDGFGFSTTTKLLENIPILHHLREIAEVKNSTIGMQVDNNTAIVAKFLEAREKNIMDTGISFIFFLRKPFPTEVYQVIQNFFEASNDPCKLTIYQQPKKLRHFIALLADRCHWLAKHADQRYKLMMSGFGNVGEQMVKMSLLFDMFLSESISLCNMTLDAEKQIYVARQCVENMKESKDSLADIPVLPCALVFCEGYPLPSELHKLTLPEAQSNPAILRAEVATAFGVENLYHIIQSQGYILTPDFALKLLIINDYMKAGHNITLCGGTGTGKTELLNVFSVIINANARDPTRNNRKLIPDLIQKIQRFLFTKMLNNLPITPEQKVKFHDFWNRAMSEEELAKHVKELCALQTVVEPPAVPNSIFPWVAHFFCEWVHSNLLKRPNILRTNFMLRLFDPDLSQPPEYNESSAPNQKVVTHGIDDLVRLLTEFRQAKFDSLFHRIRMHQRITADEFRTRINKVRAVVSRMPPSTKVVCFIDECTSTSLLGMVKEVMCDSRLDGVKLPNQIFFVAALNKNVAPSTPNLTATSDSAILQSIHDRAIDYVGIPSRLTKSFAVRPPPLSLEKIVVDFGKLTQQQEENFTRGLVSTRLPNEDDSWRISSITDTILMAQRFINEARIHRVSASIRDIMRAMDLYLYFMHHSDYLVEIPKVDSDEMVHWQSLALSVALTYYFRLPSREFIEQQARLAAQDSKHELCLPENADTPWTRKDFENHFVDLLKRMENPPPPLLYKFVDIVNATLAQLCEHTKLPPGIARTSAFLENLFCCVVCLDAKIPLVIVGPPGCSKTLSFKIAVDNMKGSSSPEPFYRKLHHILPFRYQCSEQSTDVEIKAVYKSAISRQKTFDKSSPELCAVMLDEVGLPDETQSPLKILHFKLDHPKVSSVLLSNRILDEAKTNRTLMLLQSEPPSKDLFTLAEGCIYGNDTPPCHTRDILEALCTGYQEEVIKFNAYGHPYPSRFFHLRDFVYFLRYLGKHCAEESGNPMFEINCKQVVQGLRRNFGGIPQQHFSSLVGVFFKHINAALSKNGERAWLLPDLHKHTSEIPVLRESLLEKLQEKDDPNTAPFRYIMLLDPTENEVAVSLLFDLGLCNRSSTQVCYVGDFCDDVDQRVRSAAVEKVKTAMERGHTILLVNSTSIHSSFYDVFNRHYTVMPGNRAGGPSRYCYANLAAGSFSQPCIVHDDFKVIVHVPKSKLQQIPTPLLNRFEKYSLGIEDALHERLCELEVNKLIGVHPYDALWEGTLHMVGALHTQQSKSRLFYGMLPSETVSSLVLSVADLSLTQAKRLKGDDVKYNLNSIIPQFPAAITADLSNLSPVSEENVFADSTHWQHNIRKYVVALNLHLLQLAKPESIYFCKGLPKNGELLKFANDRKMQELLFAQLHFKSPDATTCADTMEIFSLAEVTSSQQCTTKVQAFCQTRKQLFICVADLASSTANQINYLRNEINNHWAAGDTGLFRAAVIVLHLSPEISLRTESCYHAIFLKGWDFHYIDSLGLSSSTAKQNSHVEVDPKTWVAKAFKLNLAKGANTPVRPLQRGRREMVEAFQSFFFEILQQCCWNMVGTGLTPSSTLETPRARSFYSQVPGSERYTILKSLFEQQPHLHEGILEQFSRSWSTDLLAYLVQEASEALYRGVCVSSFVSIIASSLHMFMGPLISSVLRMMLASYGLESILKIGESKCSADLIELIHLVFSTIPIPTVGKQLLEGSRTSTVVVTIPRLYTFPSELPFFDTISALLLQKLNHASFELRNQQPNKIALHNKMEELLSNTALKAVVDHITSHREVFDMFKRDFLTRTLKLTDLHFSHFKQRGCSDKSILGVFVDIVLKLVKSFEGGGVEDISHLYVTKKFHEKDISYFAALITPLQLLNPFPENASLRLDTLPIFKTGTDMEQWVTRFITTILWKQLFISVLHDGTAETCKTWGQAYRMFFSRLKPRPYLCVLFSTDLRTLVMLDTLRVVFLFLLNTYVPGSPLGEPLRLKKDLGEQLEKFVEDTSSCLQEYSATRLKRALLLSLNFFSEPILIGEREENTLQGIFEYFLMDSPERETVSDEMLENVKVFFRICDGSLPEFSSNASLREICLKIASNTGWVTNFLWGWTNSKPRSCVADIYLLMAEVIAERVDSQSSLYSFKPDLFATTKPKGISTLEFLLFHMLRESMETAPRDNMTHSKQNLGLWFANLEEAVSHYNYLLVEEKNPTKCSNWKRIDILIKKAACAATVLKMAAQQLKTSNIPLFIPNVLSTVSLILRSADSPVNCKNFFLKHIPLEEDVVSLLQNQQALQQLSLNDLYSQQALTFNKMYIFAFMTTSSPQYIKKRGEMIPSGAISFTELQMMYSRVLMSVSMGAAAIIGLAVETLCSRKRWPPYEFKMCLILCCYYEYMAKGLSCPNIMEALPYLSQLLSLHKLEEAAFKFVGNGPLEVSDDRDPLKFMFSSRAQKDKNFDQTFAHLLVNVLAVGLGLPANNHIHIRMFDIVACSDTLCPGSAFNNRINWDCGFLLPENGQLQDASPVIMGNSRRCRLTLNSITWSAFCWAMLLDEDGYNKALTSVNHFLNALCDVHSKEPTISTQARVHTYILHRAHGFFSELQHDHNIISQHVRPDYYITECLLFMWQLMRGQPGHPSLPPNGIFLDLNQVVYFEETLKLCCLDNVFDNYEILSAPYLKGSLESPPSAVCEMRCFQNSLLDSPVVRWDTFLERVSCTSGCQALQEFLSASPRLPVLLNLPVFVHFYQMLNELFSLHLTEQDLFKPLQECVDQICHENSVATTVVSSGYERFITAWNSTRNVIGEIPGCPLQMNERRFELTVPFIDGGTPFVELISVQTSGHADSLYQMIRALSDEIQNKLLKLRGSHNNEEINPLGLVFEETDVKYNVEFLRTSDQCLLITCDSSPRDLEYFFIKHVMLPPDGARSKLTFSSTHLLRNVIAKYLAGKCVLQTTELRTVFPLFVPVEKEQLPPPPPLCCPKGQDPLIWELQYELDRLDENFRLACPPSVLSQFERSLKSEEEETIRDLLSTVTSFFSAMQRYIRHNPVNRDGVAQTLLASGWLEWVPTLPMPPVLNAIRTCRCCCLHAIGNSILDKYKAKQWLFKDIRDLYNRALTNQLQNSLDEKIQRVLGAPSEEKKRFLAAVTAICEFLVPNKIQGNPDTSLVGYFGDFSVMSAKNVCKTDIEYFVLNIKNCHYCSFMRKMYSLCSDLLIKLFNEEMEDPTTDKDEYIEVVPIPVSASTTSEDDPGQEEIPEPFSGDALLLIEAEDYKPEKIIAPINLEGVVLTAQTVYDAACEDFANAKRNMSQMENDFQFTNETCGWLCQTLSAQPHLAPSGVVIPDIQRLQEVAKQIYQRGQCTLEAASSLHEQLTVDSQSIQAYARGGDATNASHACDKVRSDAHQLHEEVIDLAKTADSLYGCVLQAHSTALSIPVASEPNDNPTEQQHQQNEQGTTQLQADLPVEEPSAQYTEEEQGRVPDASEPTMDEEGYSLEAEAEALAENGVTPGSELGGTTEEPAVTTNSSTKQSD
ncbi:AAA+ ATPase [Pelomyxa schiedti]|nr:AAA+ ATPase [Pelomyxa schiedti]